MSARLPIHDRLGLERGAVVVERLGSGYVRLSVVEPDGATPLADLAGASAMHAVGRVMRAAAVVGGAPDATATATSVEPVPRSLAEFVARRVAVLVLRGIDEHAARFDLAQAAAARAAEREADHAEVTA